MNSQRTHESQTHGSCITRSCVCCGREFDVLEMYLKPWDIAAGALLVREAGGFVSDFEGGRTFIDWACFGIRQNFKPSLQLFQNI